MEKQYMAANISSSSQYGTPELWGLPSNAANYLSKFLPERDHMHAGVAVQPLSTNMIDAYDIRMGRTEKGLNRLLTLLNVPCKSQETWLQEAGLDISILDPKKARVLVHQVQAEYIKNILAPQWARPATTALLELLTAEDRDALTLLRLLPGKVCRREDGTRDDSNNHRLAQLLAKAKDIHCLQTITQPRQAAPQEGAEQAPPTFLEILDGIMRVITSGIEILNSSVLSVNVDDTDKNKQDVAFAQALLASIGADGDAGFGFVVQEFMRLISQLNKSGHNEAYSMSLNTVVVPDPMLYMHLNELHQADDLQVTWNKIPTNLLKEYAVTFGCMLLRLAKKNSEEIMILIGRDYFQKAMPVTEETPIKQALRQIASFLER